MLLKKLWKVNKGKFGRKKKLMSLIIVNGFTFNCIVLYQIKENLMILKKL
jgi:hypothetical protein